MFSPTMCATSLIGTGSFPRHNEIENSCDKLYWADLYHKIKENDQEASASHL
jgi:hypothetical protein